MKNLDLAGMTMWIALGFFLFGITRCASEIHQSNNELRIEKIRIEKSHE